MYSITKQGLGGLELDRIPRPHVNLARTAGIMPCTDHNTARTWKQGTKLKGDVYKKFKKLII